MLMPREAYWRIFFVCNITVSGTSTLEPRCQSRAGASHGESVENVADPTDQDIQFLTRAVVWLLYATVRTKLLALPERASAPVRSSSRGKF